MKVVNLAQFYLDKDISGQLNKPRDTPKDTKTKKYEEFSAGNLEDAITKVVKLIANLSTEEQYAQINLLNEKETIQMLISTLV